MKILRSNYANAFGEWWDSRDPNRRSRYAIAAFWFKGTQLGFFQSQNLITPTCALQVPCNVTVKGSNSSSRLCYLLTRVIYTSGEVCLYLFFIDIDKSFLVNKLFPPVKCVVNYMVCMNLEDTFTFYSSIIHLRRLCSSMI